MSAHGQDMQRASARLRRVPAVVLLAAAMLLLPLGIGWLRPQLAAAQASPAAGAGEARAEAGAAPERAMVVQDVPRRAAPATAAERVAAAARVDEHAQHGASFVLLAGAVYHLMPQSPSVHLELPPVYEPGYVVVRGGRIAEVGRGHPSIAGLPVVDMRDAVVCPGFVSLGGAVRSVHRGPQNVSGLYRASDTLDRYANHEPLFALGTTTTYLSPGEHRLVSGVGALAKLGGPADRRLLVPEADLCINLGQFDMPLMIRPPFWASSDVAIEPAEVQRPQSRLGMLLELRERIAAAAEAEPPRRPDGTLDVHAAAFAERWRSGLPLRIRAEEPEDVAAAIAFLGSADRRGYIVGVAGAQPLAERLAAAGVPLVVRSPGGFFRPGDDLGFDPEALEGGESVLRELARLPDARFAIAGSVGDGAEDLRLAALAAVRAGVSEERALAAITRVPAEIAGVAERIGSLQSGKDADLLVLSGAPLDVSSHVLRVYIGGDEVYRAPPPPRTVVVRAGTIWVGNGEVVHDGSVLIEDGRVRAVGQRVPVPPRARIVDAGPSGWVTPGFIDAHGHLGLAGDNTTAGPELPIHRTVGAAGLEFERVARSGVTTVLLAPHRLSERGARMAAIKTWGASRDDLVTRELSGVRFSLVGSDPLAGAEALRQQLEAGRKYVELWKKYAEELEKWERGEGRETAATVEQVVDESRPDPITGKWEYTLSGEPLPEPVTGTILARLTGNRIEARLTDPTSGEEVRVTGTLDGNQVILEIDVETPVGKPVIRATITREDYMVGKIEVAGFAIDFEATRIDKSAVEFRVTRRRGRTKDGRPAAPKVDERLEPIRALLAGDVPAVVDVRTAAEIRAAVKVIIEENGLPLVLRGAEQAADLIDELLAHKDKLGVVVPPALVQQRDRRPYYPVVDLSRRGLAVALQSASADAARDLPRMGLFAVQQGLGGDAALRALTIDAARMHKLDDRIGLLEPGRDGDLLVFSGHPFDGPSRLEHVFVRGQEVPHE